MDTISWDSVSWENGGERMEAVCPACADAASKPVRLKVRSPWPPNPIQSLVVCERCGTAAYPTLTQPPYEAVFDPLVACYLEQNAGIDSMARMLSAVEPAQIRHYLELGCGYGLLLDYARTMFGWQVRGFDPGYSAQEGRVTLGVDIAHSYLETPADAGPDPQDLVFCSEVIEHVFDPLSLLTLLRGVLAPNGTLMLTTPSAGAIHAGTRPGTLLSLLSPGYHFVLFSKEGMETILRRAGFADVRVVDHGHSLQAAASPGSLAVDFDRAFDRRLYRSYLEQRIPTLDPKSPLGLGYRYRLLKELTHAGDYAAARAAAIQVAEAVRLRWDFNLADPASVLERLTTSPVPQGVEPYHASAPFNLCGILYFHGMLAWQLDGERDRAALWFQASALAGERMRAALHVIGADDGETEELSWRARSQIPHLLAWSRPEQAAQGVLTLGDIKSPLLGERIPSDILDDSQRKVFVDLVNLGQYAAADRLAAPVEANLPAEGAVLASTAFALGILTLNHRKAPRSAAALFRRAHEACRALPETAPIVAALLWPALNHQGLALANAGLRQEAGDALRALLNPAPGLPAVPPELRAQTEQLVRSQRLPV